MLGILGLAGIVPKYLAEIGVLTGGLAVLGYGRELTGRMTTVVGRLSEEEARRLDEIGLDVGGPSVAQTAGAVEVVLEILALLGVASKSRSSDESVENDDGHCPIGRG